PSEEDPTALRTSGRSGRWSKISPRVLLEPCFRIVNKDEGERQSAAFRNLVAETGSFYVASKSKFKQFVLG
ncbi:MULTISPECIES: hypothetical protein, partial [unclassified Mesorhizobium]|uniref:hypothetical protein n=1 Tax=unclassified Mesorhizobium TaxID=325217 RepID=UPI0019D0D9B7